jgi:anti-repressor protein
MSELIKIQDFSGKKAVSAKELYEALGLRKEHWAKWYRKNITGNPLVTENEDWQPLTLSVSKSGSQDFALTIDFAKKLSMMARTPAGEKIRDYFIEVEKNFKLNSRKLLSPAEALLQNVQILVNHEKRIAELDEKVNGILKVHNENHKELMDIPLSDQPVKEISLRTQVSILVNKYAIEIGMPHSVVWNQVYKELEYRYGHRIQRYKRSANESYLSVAERLGLMGKIYMIISEMVRCLAKESIKLR